MSTFQLVIFYSLVGGIVSLIGGVFLLSKKSSAETLAKYATPFAAGALLATVFLDLLKEGIEGSNASSTLLWTLLGLLLFFIMERFLRWFHHHHEHKDSHKDPSVNLVIIGNSMHNALDGVAIAASFLINVPTGIITTLAVATHEIPHEIGDFGVMLKKGLSRKIVLLVNVASALSTTVVAMITFKLGSAETLPIGALLGLSAGFLLYIALSDLIPTIHEESDDKRLFQLQPMLLIVGVIVVALSIELAHRFIGDAH